MWLCVASLVCSLVRRSRRAVLFPCVCPTDTHRRGMRGHGCLFSSMFVCAPRLELPEHMRVCVLRWVFGSNNGGCVPYSQSSFSTCLLSPPRPVGGCARACAVRRCANLPGGGVWPAAQSTVPVSLTYTLYYCPAPWADTEQLLRYRYLPAVQGATRLDNITHAWGGGAAAGSRCVRQGARAPVCARSGLLV